MTMPQSYPLAWPDGWPRVQWRKSAPYKVKLDVAVKDLLAELKRMGASDVTISSNLRNHLGVATSEGGIKDPGCAVYWIDKKGEHRVMACDRWLTLRENVRAIGLTIAAIRSIERNGASDLMDRALNGFRALPAAADPWQTLGLNRRTATTADVETRYRELARVHHPDRGGDASAMAGVNAARAQALAEIGAR